MAHQKGELKTPGSGRKKGTPNKVSLELRKAIKLFAEDHFSDFVSDWRAIESPKERAEVYIKMCKYVVPTLQSVSFEEPSSAKTTLEDQLRELSQEAEG